MKRVVCATALLGICAVGLAVAYSKEERARPDGVASASWVALGTDAGFVITGSSNRNNLGGQFSLATAGECGSPRIGVQIQQVTKGFETSPNDVSAETSVDQRLGGARVNGA